MAKLKNVTGNQRLLTLVANYRQGIADAEIPLEGYGAGVTGGTGQSTVTVTNTNDSGAGSLRDATEGQSNRIVRFDSSLSGEIVLESNWNMTDVSNVTIDGSDSSVVIRPKWNVRILNGNNILLKHLRIRAHQDQVSNGAYRCLTLRGTNLAITNCSLFWASDECIATYTDSTDITIQYCIMAESTKGGPPPGTLSGAGAFSDQSKRLSIHHNLFVSQNQRCAKMRGAGSDGSYVDFVNNVMYNIGAWWTQADNDVWCNIVNNHYKTGPSSTYPATLEILSEDNDANKKVYLSGNIGPSNSDPDADNWDSMVTHIGGSQEATVRVDTPHSTPAVTTHTALQAVTEVLARAGATLPTRDAEDQRIINEYNTGGGALINEAPY